MQFKKLYYPTIYFTLISIILCLVFINLYYGHLKVTFHDLIELINGNASRQTYLIIYEFRGPKIVSAILLGVALSACGYILQIITKNPIADPGILGLSSGANTFILIYIFINAIFLKGERSIISLQVASIVGALISAFVLILLTTKNLRLDSSRLVLNGIALNSGYSVIILYIGMRLSTDDYESVANILSGAAFSVSKQLLMIATFSILSLSLITLLLNHYLKFFTMSHQSLTSIGFSTHKYQLVFILIAIGFVGTSVMLSGNINFIGLISPYIAKLLTRENMYTHLLSLSMIVGVILMLLCNYLSFNLLFPTTLPIGIITALIGCPFLLCLMIFNEKLH